MTTKASEDNGTPFDPSSHLTDIKGKDYLEVKWRLVWFRSEHPLDSGWGIRTVAEEVTPQGARYRAQVVNPDGSVVAEGTKTETPKGFADFVEKAETGAIGRALAICGYGTQFAGDELDEGARIVDSPVAHKPAARPAPERPVAVPHTPAAPGGNGKTPEFSNPGDLFQALLEKGVKPAERNEIRARLGIEADWKEMGPAGWKRVYEEATHKEAVPV